jgi:rubrerythrin
MIRQLSNDGLKFRSPRLERSLPAFSKHSYESADFGYLVADESLLKLGQVEVGVQFCGVTVDVLGLVEGVPFVVFVTYRERSLPSDLKNPSMNKCGVVELNVNAVQRLFKQVEKGQYKDVLRRCIEDETEGKTWAYHPRELRLREAAIAKRQAWLLKQKTEAMVPAANSKRLNGSGKSMVSSPFIESYKAPERIIGKYICVMCKSTWEGTSRVCKKCNTHLYTTERE